MDDDLAGAWTATRDVVRAAVEDPGVAHLEYASESMGTATFEHGNQVFATFDPFVHTWDPARAAGLYETLDPDEVDRAYQRRPMGEIHQEPGLCGLELEPPPGADEQTSPLSCRGRRV